MVNSSEEGFQKVLDNTNGEFAFVHDASEIRYEFYNNCNYTEVGEPFAEQPYAVAVQQGSHLQEEISKVILELQKDRYFETLYGKYVFRLIMIPSYLKFPDIGTRLYDLTAQP